MRVPWSVALTGAGLAVLVVAGCGSDDAQAIAWSDKVCGAMVSFRDTISSTAPNVGADDVSGRARKLSEFTGHAATAAQGAIADLDAAGAAPVNGGESVVRTLKYRMTVIQTTFATAKSQVDAVDVRAADAESTLGAAVAPLQRLTNLPDPAADLEANPDLRGAVDAAASCQKLRQSSGNTSGG